MDNDMDNCGIGAQGATDSRSAALKSLNQRRDYGAQPSAACISKSTERALREEGRVQQPPRAAPGNDLDALDWEEEEDWGSEMVLEEEHAWEPQGLHSQQAHLQTVTTLHQRQHQQHHQQQPQQLVTQQGGMQPHMSQGLVPCRHHGMSGQTSAAQKSDQTSPPLVCQPNRQHGATPNSSTQQACQVSNASQQSQLVRPAIPAQSSLGIAEAAVLSSDMDDCQVLGAAGCLQKASLPLQGSNSWSSANVVADNAAGPDSVSCQGTVQGDLDAVRLPGTCQILCQVQAQPAVLDTAADTATASNTGALGDGQAAICVPSSEQSDYQLALRLQAQEHAIHRSNSRPVVNGRMGVRQKQPQTSGTLHAFFKKS